MSWQEELPELDALLAAGQISADEYRQRRDQLLAQASGHAATPAPSTSSDPPSAEPPAASVSPFPPAFSWQTGNTSPSPQSPSDPAESNQAEQTQFIAPLPQPATHNSPADSDRTQVVSRPPNSTASEQTQIVRGAEVFPDNTQVVPSAHTPPPGFPTSPQPAPWANPAMAAPTPPPWAGNELPPDYGQQIWSRQGGEIFERTRQKKNRTIGFVLGAIVLVAAIGAIIYFTVIANKDNPPSSQPAPSGSSSVTSSGPKLPDGPFVELPGQLHDSVTVSIAEAVAAKVPSEAEANLLRDVGVAKVGMYVTKEGQLTRAIWTFTPAAGSDPQALISQLDRIFAQAGYQEVAGLPARVSSRGLGPSAQNPVSSYRAHFVTQGVVVQISVFGPDEAQAKATFMDIVRRETEKFPPSQ